MTGTSAPASRLACAMRYSIEFSKGFAVEDRVATVRCRRFSTTVAPDRPPHTRGFVLRQTPDEDCWNWLWPDEQRWRLCVNSYSGRDQLSVNGRTVATTKPFSQVLPGRFAWNTSAHDSATRLLFRRCWCGLNIYSCGSARLAVGRWRPIRRRLDVVVRSRDHMLHPLVVGMCLSAYGRRLRVPES